jgi:uncharacterized protein (DUF885 family)
MASRPGIYYAHLSDMNAMPTYMLEDIAYHEGLPGHHMQISIQQELEAETGPNKLPKFRTQYGYTAYSEGWGLYSEALSKEMGFLKDPYSHYGQLSGEIWRAIRLVVDTGIHSKGWTEEQAVKYFTDNSSIAEGAIASEVRRYITTAGQATAYKIGMIRCSRCATRRGPSWATSSTIRLSTTRSSGAAHCPFRFWSGRLIAGSKRRRQVDPGQPGFGPAVDPSGVLLC